MNHSHRLNKGKPSKILPLWQDCHNTKPCKPRDKKKSHTCTQTITVSNYILIQIQFWHFPGLKKYIMHTILTICTLLILIFTMIQQLNTEQPLAHQAVSHSHIQRKNKMLLTNKL